MEASKITIYHNPKCSKSRETLALIREQGYEPEIVEYTKTPLTPAVLKKIIADLKVPARSLLRENDPYQELKLNEDHWQEDELIDYMIQYPALMNRPIVVTSAGTRLCRPPETVLEILPK